MTRLDDKLVPAAQRLINKFGKTATVTTEAAKTYDPETGKTSNTGETVNTVKISPPAPYEIRYITAGVVDVGDQRTIIAAKDLTFTLKTGQLLTVDSDKWRIVSVNSIRSGEQIAAFELQLRK